MSTTRREFLLASLAPALHSAPPGRSTGASVELVPGPVNGVILNREGHRLAVYGDPRSEPPAFDQVLLTTSRRDVSWAARGPARRGAAVLAPSAESKLLEDPRQFWTSFRRDRFHDYAMINSKVPAEPLPVARKLRGGDRVEWRGVAIEVLDTPGYTPGSVTYLFTLDGKRIACTGDLICGSGQLLDLFSLQDAVPEAKLRGYHGYAARAGEWIRSLRSIAASRPDVLIPARGPVIDNPGDAIDRVISRMKTVLREHFSTDALRWYFGDDNLRLRAGKVLEGEAPPWMPMSFQQKLPSWLVAIENSRLLLSESRSAFLVDCGSDAIVDELRRRQGDGGFRNLEGIFITHYHDDHTDRAQRAAELFGCPVYFTTELLEVLENPKAYRMPCLSDAPIRSGKAAASGSRMRWHEFEFTFSWFPGQTLLHDSLLARKDTGEAVLFAGDSFTPSGMDDYCLWNRNFLGKSPGYRQCLDQLRRLPHGHLVVNQHVEPAFRFSPEQLDFMEASLRRREEAMRALFPWPDLNYGIDEQWVRLSPYESEARAGGTLELRAVIRNHSSRPQSFTVRPNPPAGWTSEKMTYRLQVPAGAEAEVSLKFRTNQGGNDLAIVTADVEFAGWTLREWTEAIVHLT